MKNNVAVVVMNLRDRIHDEIGNDPGRRQPAQKTCGEEGLQHNEVDDDIVLGRFENGMRHVGVEHTQIALPQGDVFAVDNLLALAGVDVIDFDVVMDMHRNFTVTGMLADRHLVDVKRVGGVSGKFGISPRLG
ncbi:hypothetical protein D3C80_1676550 [compost metagenome]